MIHFENFNFKYNPPHIRNELGELYMKESQNNDQGNEWIWIAKLVDLSHKFPIEFKIGKSGKLLNAFFDEIRNREEPEKFKHLYEGLVSCLQLYTPDQSAFDCLKSMLNSFKKMSPGFFIANRFSKIDVEIKKLDSEEDSRLKTFKPYMRSSDPSKAKLKNITREFRTVLFEYLDEANKSELKRVVYNSFDENDNPTYKFSLTIDDIRAACGTSLHDIYSNINSDDITATFDYFYQQYSIPNETGKFLEQLKEVLLSRSEFIHQLIGFKKISLHKISSKPIVQSRLSLDQYHINLSNIEEELHVLESLGFGYLIYGNDDEGRYLITYDPAFKMAAELLGINLKFLNQYEIGRLLNYKIKYIYSSMREYDCGSEWIRKADRYIENALGKELCDKLCINDGCYDFEGITWQQFGEWYPTPFDVLPNSRPRLDPDFQP